MWEVGGEGEHLKVLISAGQEMRDTPLVRLESWIQVAMYLFGLLSIVTPLDLLTL